MARRWFWAYEDHGFIKVTRSERRLAESFPTEKQALESLRSVLSDEIVEYRNSVRVLGKAIAAIRAGKVTRTWEDNRK